MEGILQQADDDNRRPGFGAILSVHGNHLLVGAGGAAYIYDLDMIDADPVRLAAEEDRSSPGLQQA